MFSNMQISVGKVLIVAVFLCTGCGRGVLSSPAHNNRGQPASVIGATQAPKFTSRGQTYRVVIGDTLVLPCEVENMGSYVLLWRRGTAVLTASTLMVTRDSRFRLVDGYNLEISDVMPQDAGDYVCQLADQENRDQIHTVEILVPPSIRTSPSNGQLTVRKGGTITLECKASGNPVPTIIWSKKESSLPSGEKSLEGFSITLEKVDRHQAGVYQCTATNGVGDPVTVDMTLEVLYPPEIEVERSWVHSGEGYEAQLVCIVHGEPAPDMSWYQDTFLIEPSVSDRRLMETRGNKHTLTIKNVQSTDFGNYSCVADNNLGRAKKYMELSGKPSLAEFKSAPMSRTKDTYNLTWQIESYPPLLKVRLLYRKVRANDTYSGKRKATDFQYRRHNNMQQHGGSAWHDQELLPPKSETFTHMMSYSISNLEPSSTYAAVVQAMNKYGWGAATEDFYFDTRSQGKDSPLRTFTSTRGVKNTRTKSNLLKTWHLL
uniref:Lachesin n=1 Tax=Cacopsylla melanoneura TaxID=428564 RepID=A0A8D8LHE8_9HEMI